MLRYIALSLVLFLLLPACAPPPESDTAPTNTNTTTAPQPDSLLRHAVFFAYTPETTPADIDRIEAAFAALPTQIDGILAFERGANVSPENLAKGLTHAYLLTFASAAARDAYLPHPAHAAFGELLTPHLADVLVIDYWATE